MISITEIGHADIDTFWELHWAYLNRDIFDEHDTDELREHFRSSDYRGTIEKYMDRFPDKAHLLYFIREGIRIGCAQYIIYKSEDGKCFILDFWVFPEYRGNGTGHDCFTKLSQYAQADEALYFELNVANERGHKFWSDNGFADNGTDEYGMPLMKKA